MFTHKSAWFSGSVPQTCVNFWLSEGGSVTDWRTADYLFSEDALFPDTLGIFESRDYLWSKVDVFHCRFLSTCETRRSVKSVCIGHYILPPASVQDDVRNKVGRFIWECEDEQSVQDSYKAFQTDTENSEEVNTSDYEPSDTESESTGLLSGTVQDHSLSNTPPGYVSMDSLKKYSGDLSDFCLHCFHSYSCSAACSKHQSAGTERKQC